MAVVLGAVLGAALAAGLVLAPWSAALAATPPAAPRATTAPEPAGRYGRPVDGSVVHGFDPPAVRWGSGHRGVDLAAVPGAQVLAPTAGVVTFAGTVAGRGVLTVRGDDGLLSSLEPVTASVPAGARVARGDVVAVLDDPGDAGHCLPASCVHWGVRRGETYLDPLALLGTDPIVLLPIEDD